MTRAPIRVQRQKEEWIELKPYGLATSLDPSRPMMLFRSLDEEYTVGVPLSPIEASISIAQSEIGGAGASPHELSIRALTELGIVPKKCLFKRVAGQFLYVDIEFSGNDSLKKVECRVDESLSFCLRANTKFFCTRKLLMEMKELEASALQISQDYRNESNPIWSNSTKNHPYMM